MEPDHSHLTSAGADPVQRDKLPAATRALYSAVLLVVCLVLFELGSYGMIAVLLRKGWMAYIPDFTPEQVELYLRGRDPTLGWAFDSDSTWGQATNAEGRIRRAIPRRDPAPSASGAPCVSTYGDSFVYGTEASDSGTYPHHLGRLLACPVRNFGVPGYGSDQALMLFRAQADVDSAPVVVFQHLTENILRNVNRYANLLYPGSPLRFKPRFVRSGDSIAYLAAPVNAREDFRRVVENPDSALAPDGLLTRPRPHFPFTVALLRWVATDIKVRARISGVPVEAGYYAADHPAQGLDLTVAVMAAAVHDAATRGRRGVILLQTTRQGLIYARDQGRWLDSALHETLRSRGLPVIHAGPPLLAALGARHPCELFEGCTQTHMNSEGNRILAEIVADFLRSEGSGAPASSPVRPPTRP